MKILLLNGPPRSGKDTIGEMLRSTFAGLQLRKFAHPIVRFMQQEFGVDMRTVDKDSPHHLLHGRTPREVAIAYSEKLCKPLFGVHFFGHRAVSGLRLVPSEALVCFTDSGFAHEVKPVADAYGTANLLQILLRRPGTSFHGDSRSYWSLQDIATLEFDNDCASLIELRGKVDADLIPEVKSWLAK